MFYAHAAIALELIALTLGSWLVLATRHSCCRKDVVREGRDVVVREGRDVPPEVVEKSHHNGFFKFVGYFTIVISFIAIICTVCSSIYMWTYYDVMDPLERSDMPAYQYHNDTPSNALPNGVNHNMEDTEKRNP